MASVFLAVFVNGKICKDPNKVTADDFFFPGPNMTGLNVPRNTSNPRGSVVTIVNVNVLPGLNTLGDIFVFPQGLIHFQLNLGKTNAVTFAGQGSQNPGIMTIANAVFGSDPPINLDVLTKAFQVDTNVIKYLQRQFW
ncbi:germin subfamily 1 member 7 [Olea europaea subsp. europaea]|uniref:Germin-like protein n=1 Tax=Olea europaea subsp. europaea TaxID=158383 RepID=A0A8S0QP23_OLEEU|nr:germin subfamily 1 member 7 [Olea europaea subsp. europaea]